MSEQAELPIAAARMWPIKFAYQNLVRAYGALVPEQVREHRDFPGVTREDAERAARDWFDEQMLADYRRIGHQLASMETGDRIKKPGTFRLRK